MDNMIEKFFDSILTRYINDSILIRLASELIILGVIVVFAVLAYYIVSFIAKHYIRIRLMKSESTFVQFLAKKNGVAIFGHLASALTFRIGSNFIIRHNDEFTRLLPIIINKLSMLYLFLTIVIIFVSIIKAINPYYEKTFNFAKRYPIKPYINVVVLFIWILWIVFIIAYFSNSSVSAIFTAIGAASAVFLLIFRDTLLGIMSSIQAAASNIVRIGDRICIEKYNLDGTVISIAINSVRIKNSDNTVATVPTYMLTSEVVKNWRTMTEYGERRIKRAILIDVNTIRQCSDTELNKFANISCLSEYITKKPQSKKISNLALFRLYIENYLRESAFISKTNTILVRHLDPGQNGLPVEIYAYTTNTNWNDYEQTLSEVMEYCFLKMEMFNLKAFQNSNS